MIAAIEPTWYLLLSALLFSIGAFGLLVRRNPLVMFMCIELMLNATNLAFVTFARMKGNLDGQVIAFFVMVVAAAEVVVGLGILVSILRARPGATADDLHAIESTAAEEKYILCIDGNHLLLRVFASSLWRHIHDGSFQ